MKRIIAIIILVCLLSSLAGCGYEYKELDLKAEYTKDLAGTTLTVYNWGEYISDGADDTIDVNREFEKLTGIKVNYLTFESNETMYSQVKNGGVNYDIVIPSDYMIERMLKEDMLAEIDTSALSNYHLIDSQYKNIYFDPENKYSVPFNVGMVGIIYNGKHIKNIEQSWDVLWDSKYKDMVLNFNNPRDAFMTAQMKLGLDLNSEDEEDWKKAAELLKKGKDNLQAYVMDEVYGKMETGEAYIAPYYAGDYLTMVETNPDLEFFYPKEGTNIFIDSACILKSAKNKEAAMLYLNFLLEPDIATANAEYIGYASPNTAVIANPDYYYFGNEILYPSEKNMPPVQYYHDISTKTRNIYENLWIDVKLY